MPTLDELLNIAKNKTEKKKFSRGNRPDTMLRDEVLAEANASQKTLVFPEAKPSVVVNVVEKEIPIRTQTLKKEEFEPSSNLVQTRFKQKLGKDLAQASEKSPMETLESKTEITPEVTAEKASIESERPLSEAITAPLINASEIENPIKTRFEPSSNQVQTRFKPSLNPIQTPFEPRSNAVQEVPLEPSNLVQTGFEPSLEPSSNFSIKKLSPLQISILEYLNELCIELRSDITSPVKIIDLVSICNCSIEGAKTAIKRMIKQNIISRIDYKDGRNGWCQYRISKDLHRELIEYKKNDMNLVQTRFKPSLEPSSTPPSKLVSNINNNLLTSEHQSEVPTQSTDACEVTSINIEHLLEFKITRKQIQDIKNQKLNFTTSTLQDFVDRFAIYASDPKNIKNVNSIPAIFVKMAQLASKGEDPLVDIETDNDRFIREHLERLKAKRENRLRQQSEILDLEFENWLDEIQTKGQDEIAPPTQMMKSGSVAQKMTLKIYFTRNIWPSKANAIGISGLPQ